MCALGLVTWGQESTRRFRCPAGFESSSLGVVVLKKIILLWWYIVNISKFDEFLYLSVSIFSRNVLKNDSPKTFDIYSPPNLGIVNIWRAEIAFWAYPMRCIIWGWAFWWPWIVAVIKGMLLELIHVFHQVIRTLNIKNQKISCHFFANFKFSFLKFSFITELVYTICHKKIIKSSLWVNSLFMFCEISKIRKLIKKTKTWAGFFTTLTIKSILLTLIWLFWVNIQIESTALNKSNWLVFRNWLFYKHMVYHDKEILNEKYHLKYKETKSFYRNQTKLKIYSFLILRLKKAKLPDLQRLSTSSRRSGRG